MSAVLYDVAGPKARRRIQVFTIVGSLVLLGLLALAAVQLAANDQFDADKYEPFVGEDASTLWPNIFEALALGTLRAAAYALVLALALGMVLAFGRLSTRESEHEGIGGGPQGAKGKRLEDVRPQR